MRSTNVLAILPIMLIVLGHTTVQWDGDGPNGDPIETPSRDTFEWLIMVYVAGDNDLGEDGQWGNAAVMDLDEMEESVPETGVRILALTDLKGPSNSALYDIRPDQQEGLNSPTIPLSELDGEWSDELNMGLSSTLEKFIQYSMTSTSYQRSMFVMWDHGSGWLMEDDVSTPPSTRGFAQDQYPQPTYMYLDEMRDSFMRVEEDIGHFEIDIMAHDTCYMAMVEIFYQFARWSHYAVGSMDEQPFYGYNYTFISSLEGPGPHYARELAVNMAELFRQEYSDSSDTYHTVVVADVDVLKEDFLPAWDALSTSLYSRMFHLEVEKNGLFDLVSGMAESVGIDSVDAGSLIDVLIEKDIDQNVTELALGARDAYNRTAIHSWMIPDGRNPRGTGMTIYLPMKELAFKPQYDGSYGFLNFTADSFWDETMREFQNPVERLRMNLSVVETDVGSTGYGISVNVTDPRTTPPAPAEDVRISVNGVDTGWTDVNGHYLFPDVLPGIYRFIAEDGLALDIARIKALNRPPVAMVQPNDPTVGEGIPLILKGNLSYDPDGDLVKYSWDLNETDGLNGTDSTDPVVELLYADDGNRTVRLTVNDSMESSTMDIDIEVVNLPPRPSLEGPLGVYEDQMFTLDAGSSTDSPGDISTLEYRFTMDSEPLNDWSGISFMETSLGSSGSHSAGVEVRDKDGGLANEQFTIQVYNEPPVPIIEGPLEINEDQTVRYNAYGSHDTPSDMDDLSFRWFLDGGQEPVHAGPYLDLNFTEEGEHTLELQVSDGDADDPDTIRNRTGVVINVSNVVPVAVIEGPDNAMEADVIRLNGSGSIDTLSDREDLEMLWDMDGDGSFDTEGNKVDVIFTDPGSRFVSLKVIDDDGAVSISDHMITVFNRPPTPDFQIPDEVREDQNIDILPLGEWDTDNDIEGLKATWFIDEDPIAAGVSPPTGLKITEKGRYSIRVEAIDDQGLKGTHIETINVSNPLPDVVLSGVPEIVGVGEEFVARGYRSTDNPSDMESLEFRWYIDGELVDTGIKNRTFRFRSTGVRNISLEVTDDDGEGFMVSLEVSVERDPFAVRVLEFMLSSAGLMLMLILVVFIISVLFLVRMRTDQLSPPSSPDREGHEETANERPPDKVGSDVARDRVGDDRFQWSGGVTPGSVVEGSDGIELPEMDPPPMPEHEKIDDFQVPEPEKGLVKDI